MASRKDRTQALAARSRFWIDDLHVQPDRLLVMRGREEFKLELRMMEVLVMLAEHAGETVTKESLLVEIWGNKVYGDSPVNKAVSGIRDRIGDDARNPHYIETVSKIGFRMKMQVSLPEDYRRMSNELWQEDSPYVGLSAFDARHNAVFCGRSRVIGDLLRAMRNQIENERRFVMIVGASGCGKTSLFRAGTIPLLTKPDGFEGLRALSVANCDLAAAQIDDPLTPLIAALATWTLGGEPVFPPQTTEQLRSQLCNSPHTIAPLVSESLRRRSGCSMDQEPLAHLLLSIDHAETLVASADIDNGTRYIFMRLVLALCECKHILVTMIARSDFYPKLMEAMPVLADLKAGDGHLDVMMPNKGEIAEIIRHPAWKANLRFENHRDSRDRLDDVLRDAAASQPDALPLLQHTLGGLYERKTEGGVLTFVAYNDIGGLEGAIAHRAEQVFAELPQQAQSSLNTVLARLVVVQSDSEAVSARRAHADDFKDEAKTLVEAFISARLFVGDHSDGRATVGVAHEALLRRWPRAAEWVQENRRLLTARTRLQRAAQRWVEEGAPDDRLLNAGRPLEEAQEVAAAFPREIGDEEQRFLHISQKLQRRKHRLKIAAISMLLALTVASSSLAIIAAKTQKEVETQRDSLVKQAFAFRSVGEMVFKDADIKGAETAFLTVNENMRIAHESNPDSVETLMEYGVWSYWLGYFYYQNGQPDRAEPHWTKYLEISRKLIQLEPHNIAWKMELSYALNNIGNLRKKNLDTKASLRYFIESEKIKREVLNAIPKNSELIHDYIDTLSWIGSAHESLGDLRSADSRYLQLIDMARELVSHHDNNNSYRRKLGNELWRHARLASAMGSRKKAFELIDESILHLRELVRREPTNEQFRRDLSNALLESGLIALDAGKITLAISRVTSSKTEIDKIIMGPKTRPSWLRLRATINLNLAALSTEAERDLVIDGTLGELALLASRYPGEPQFAIDLAKARILRGKIRASSGDIAGANEDWRLAKAGLDRMTEKTRDHTILVPWINACILLGKKAEAMPHLQKLLRNGHAGISNPLKFDS